MTPSLNLPEFSALQGPQVLIDHLESFGFGIAKARAQRGLTQRQLAQRMGVCVATVTRLEQGRPRVSLKSVMACLHAFDVRDGLASLIPTLDCTQTHAPPNMHSLAPTELESMTTTAAHDDVTQQGPRSNAASGELPDGFTAAAPAVAIAAADADQIEPMKPLVGASQMGGAPQPPSPAQPNPPDTKKAASGLSEDAHDAVPCMAHTSVCNELERLRAPAVELKTPSVHPRAIPDVPNSTPDGSSGSRFDLVSLATHEAPQEATPLEFVVWFGEPPERVGNLSVQETDEAQVCGFRFTRSWLSKRRAACVSPDLLHTTSAQGRKMSSGEPGSPLPLALADTLAGGFSERLNRHARALGVAFGYDRDDCTAERVHRLLSVPDLCRLGALRLHTQGTKLAEVGLSLQSLPCEADLSKMNRNLTAFERGQATRAEIESMLIPFSGLDGSRAKCTWVDGQNQMHVAKFASIHDEHDVPRLEVLISQLARAARMQTVPMALLHPIMSPWLTMPRLDRTPLGRRVPFISGTSLAKSANPDSVRPTVSDLLQAMQQHGEDFQRDAAAVWHQLVLRCLIDERSDDLRKLSFLGNDAGQWRLAPAFGLRPHVYKTLDDPKAQIDHEPSIEVGDRLTALLRDSPQFGLKREQALLLARQTLYSFYRWREYAQQFAVMLSTSDSVWLNALLTPRLNQAQSVLG